LIFVETTRFTRQICELVTDASYAKLQTWVASNPRVGDLMPGSGGLRKLRWKRAGGGKRGGIRIIYFWCVSDDVILMLLAFAKSEQEDLTREQLKLLKKVVEQELRNG
jgi:hypothetical protein